MTYSYDPLQIKARGKDQMRFELGDTLIEGGADTCALADEEYTAMLADIKPGKKAWLYAKLAVIEAIMFKLNYQVDTKIDVLTYNFDERAERWRKLYNELKAEITAATTMPTIAPSIEDTPPYFHKEMKANPRAFTSVDTFPFRKMTT